MLKHSIFAIGFLGLFSCSSGSGEKYLVFQDHILLSGDISIEPRLNRNVNREKMDGAIYININKAFKVESKCKIQAKIISQNMDLERSRMICDTDNNTCFFNTGDFQNDPRMVLRLRNADLTEIPLVITLINEFEGNEKQCEENRYELLLEPKLRKLKFWEKAFAR